ncbi:MAG TPA: hypothetical protein VG758_15785 [Hyphomicrobiaceae bacterium]|jgi:hypothetical protein|nr:hypothetical protein [Hyphomicrobiaceae bacterium]
MAQTPLAAPSAGPATADNTDAGRIRTHHGVTAGLLAAAFAGLAVPVLLAEIPPLLDYPNHLVRLWLIAGGAEIEPLSRMYAVSWTSAHTNVGIDYLAAFLGRIVPAVPLGSFLVLLSLVLPPLGAVALNRALFGGTHWWQIGFVMFAWTATLIAGFLNFQIGIGCALLAASLEPRLARGGPWPRLLARAGLAAGLLFVHMFALFCYCALLGGLALGPGIGALASWRRLAARARAVIVAVVPAVAPALLFVGLAPSLPGAHVEAATNPPMWDLSVLGKLHVLLSPIATYNLWLDLASLAAAAVPLAVAVAAGRVQAHAGLLISAAALLVLALAAPTFLAGTWWIDNRFPLMAAFAVVAGLRPDLPFAAAGKIAAAVALALVVTLRTGWIGAVWHERQADIRAVERAVQSVPAGSAVLPLDNTDDTLEPSAYPPGRYFHNGHPTHWSFSVLAIMWRRVFVPNLFWALGKQPLAVLPPWTEISFPEDGLHPAQELLDPRRTPAHFADWRRRYDYVLLLNADAGKLVDLARLPELVLERDEGFARLYRVARKARPR